MNGRAAESPSLSIIIPSWRDAENLAVLLPRVCGLSQVREVIVADASAAAETEEIVRDAGASFVACSMPNRGAQMNRGGRSASGEVLLFQHADTELTDTHVQAITVAMRDPQIVGGAFYRRFDQRHPRLMFLEKVARFLTRHGGTLYGDQSVFVRREIFHRLGGFAEIPLMEDMEFSRRLRAAGRVAILDPPIKTSPRRHARHGAWRISVQNALFIILFKLGVSPHTLHRWYYRTPKLQPASGS